MYVLIEHEENADGAQLRMLGSYDSLENARDAMVSEYELNWDDGTWDKCAIDDRWAIVYSEDFHLSDCVRWVIFDEYDPKTAIFE